MPDKKPAILVIEDDAFMSALLRFMFERDQMQVLCLSDGRAALEHLKGAPDVDAVVLDLMLPQVSGMAVLAALRQSPGWTRVPVVVLSALDAGAEIARAFEAGADDYVTKPFDPQALSARLARLLRAAQDAGHAL